MQFPRSHRRIEGFTLTELLVVIGIIIILIGVTLPVIKRMRIAAQTADTQNEISQISNACSAYYTTFHAYPGPFSNDDTSGGLANHAPNGFGTGSGTPTLTSIYVNGTPPQLVSSDSFATNPWTVTGAQNLVLGLMGGLRPITSPPNLQLAFAPAEVGQGPLSLNVLNPNRTPSFLPNGATFLTWCQQNSAGQNVQSTGTFQNVNGAGSNQYSGTPFTDAAGAAAFDAPIPVFTDRFPTPGPLPLLYLRARAGAKGIVWDNITVQLDPTGGPAYYQYDLRDILPYTTSHIGLPASTGARSNNQHNLTSIGQFPTNMSVTTDTSLAAEVNAGPYFMNTAITPTDVSNPPASINYTGRPRSVDQYIIISAGPDGIYGTPDDITSFGNVSN